MNKTYNNELDLLGFLLLTAFVGCQPRQQAASLSADCDSEWSIIMEPPMPDTWDIIEDGLPVVGCRCWWARKKLQKKYCCGWPWAFGKRVRILDTYHNNGEFQLPTSSTGSPGCKCMHPLGLEVVGQGPEGPPAVISPGDPTPDWWW